jgi:hypothetical protein
MAIETESDGSEPFESRTHWKLELLVPTQESTYEPRMWGSNSSSATYSQGIRYVSGLARPAGFLETAYGVGFDTSTMLPRGAGFGCGRRRAMAMIRQFIAAPATKEREKKENGKHCEVCGWDVGV